MGAEGATDDNGIREARSRRRRNMMATLLLSQGVPMIVAGDEVGNSQGGNNNTYCQDNETGWVDWSGLDDPFLTFCQKMIALRKEYPELRQERFLTGAVGEDGRTEIAWYRPDGQQMGEEDWNDPELRLLSVYISYSANTPDVDKRAGLFMVLNAGGDCEIRLPQVNEINEWSRVLSTGVDDPFTRLDVDEPLTVERESVAAFIPRGG
jgi:glycogen operon protein